MPRGPLGVGLLLLAMAEVAWAPVFFQWSILDALLAVVAGGGFALAAAGIPRTGLPIPAAIHTYWFFDWTIGGSGPADVVASLLMAVGGGLAVAGWIRASPLLLSAGLLVPVTSNLIWLAGGSGAFAPGNVVYVIGAIVAAIGAIQGTWVVNATVAAPTPPDEGATRTR